MEDPGPSRRFTPLEKGKGRADGAGPIPGPPPGPSQQERANTQDWLRNTSNDLMMADGRRGVRQAHQLGYMPENSEVSSSTDDNFSDLFDARSSQLTGYEDMASNRQPPKRRFNPRAAREAVQDWVYSVPDAMKTKPADKKALEQRRLEQQRQKEAAAQQQPSSAGSGVLPRLRRGGWHVPTGKPTQPGQEGIELENLPPSQTEGPYMMSGGTGPGVGAPATPAPHGQPVPATHPPPTSAPHPPPQSHGGGDYHALPYNPQQATPAHSSIQQAPTPSSGPPQGRPNFSFPGGARPSAVNHSMEPGNGPPGSSVARPAPAATRTPRNATQRTH